MIFGFRFGSVVGKTWVLVRFVLAEFGFLPISKLNNKPWKPLPTNMTHKASSATSVLIDTLKYGLNYLFSLLTRFFTILHSPAALWYYRVPRYFFAVFTAAQIRWYRPTLSASHNYSRCRVRRMGCDNYRKLPTSSDNYRKLTEI